MQQIGICTETWPDYLQLNMRKNKGELRSNCSKSLEIPRKESGSFQDNATGLFNSLPETTRKCSDYYTTLTVKSNLYLDLLNIHCCYYYCYYFMHVCLYAQFAIFIIFTSYKSSKELNALTKSKEKMNTSSSVKRSR